MSALPENIFELDTPALIVDLDRLERNVTRMARLAAASGKALWPHTKTHKSADIARLQLDTGATGLTVAKLGEAEVLVEAGFDRLFIANEIVGSIKIERLIALLGRAEVIIGVDSADSAGPIAEAGRRAGLSVPVRMEVDTGLHRAGVRSLEDAVELALSLDQEPGLDFRGIFTHEGTSYRSDPDERAANCRCAAEKVRAIAAAVEDHGVQVRDRSVGSTPGAEYMAAEHGITELRPGNYVFFDAMQNGFGARLEDCALSVLSTVISLPDAETAIIDAGTKSLAGDRALVGSKHGIVLGLEDAVFDWASEEHGHLDITACSRKPKFANKLRVVPYHACVCVNMHSEMWAVRGDQIAARWTVVGRGRIQ